MKKYSVLALMILSLALLSSCKPSQPSAPASSATGSSTASPEESTEAPAVAAGSLGYCLESCNIIKEDKGLVSKETCRSGCFMNEAKEKKDPEVCSANVKDSLMLSGCLTAVAEAMESVTACDKIGSDSSDLMRGACYSTVAEKKKDSSVCEGIKNSMMYSGCVSAAANQ